jgi:2-polyprenyl-3-methyl-5-hydroxy-6-metoxy-1,4-benzoquinol methylase
VNEPTAAFLVSDAGRVLLIETAALAGDPAARVLALRKRGHDSALAAGAVEIVDAQNRARARFGDLAAQLFFTRDALAQATSPTVAAYHGANLSAHGGTIVDLGCGVGMDAIALAKAGAEHVLAIDHDPAPHRSRARQRRCQWRSRRPYHLARR